MAGLGAFDIVYSWGVLHHTGAMWPAIDLASDAVRPNGLFFIALYNDQGWRSAKWLRIKRVYNRLPQPLRMPYVLAVTLPYVARSLARHLLQLRPTDYVRTWTQYGAGMGRGMNKWRDWVDWVGGLPFEVAKPDDVVDILGAKGFVLRKLVTRLGGWGCNEFVFRRSVVAS
jgi:2-polyprenyl-6-hydroxyphenyl methylase/3-demethylubiquinone-9 3-methyltransferase